MNPAEQVEEELTKLLWEQYEEERARFLEELRREEESPHGTRSNYVRGCRCDECKRASSEYAKARRRAKGIQPRPKRTHGTTAMYKGAKCRCGPCQQAMKKYWREQGITTKSRPLPRKKKESYVHGTSWAYRRGCRCDVCVTGYHEENKARWAYTKRKRALTQMENQRIMESSKEGK